MLHWVYFFLYIFLCVLGSIILYNKSLLQLLLIGEILVILLFIVFLVLSTFYNIYYLIGLSFFLLIFGGLELSLNILLLTL